MIEYDIAEQFEIWWYNEGSSENFANKLNYDDEERVKKICEIAWLQGASHAQQNLIDSEKARSKAFGIYVKDCEKAL